MQIISEKGKLFDIINIIDLALLLFVLLIITSTYVYTHSPPRVREHQEVIFQMYFIDVPYSVGQELFIPGNEFIATYDTSDKAKIIAVEPVDIQTSLNDRQLLSDGTPLVINQDGQAFQFIPPYEGYKMNYLVTIYGSLQIDAEGDLLFNDQNVGSGNILYLQLNNSHLAGVVWRMKYTSTQTNSNVTVLLKKEFYPLPPTVGEVVFLNGEKAGNITTVVDSPLYYFVTFLTDLDVYNGEYFFNEYPLFATSSLPFSTLYEEYEGRVIEVS